MKGAMLVGLVLIVGLMGCQAPAPTPAPTVSVLELEDYTAEFVGWVPGDLTEEEAKEKAESLDLPESTFQYLGNGVPRLGYLCFRVKQLPGSQSEFPYSASLASGEEPVKVGVARQLGPVGDDVVLVTVSYGWGGRDEPVVCELKRNDHVLAKVELREIPIEKNPLGDDWEETKTVQLGEVVFDVQRATDRKYKDFQSVAFTLEPRETMSEDQYWVFTAELEKTDVTAKPVPSSNTFAQGPLKAKAKGSFLVYGLPRVGAVSGKIKADKWQLRSSGQINVRFEVGTEDGRRFIEVAEQAVYPGRKDFVAEEGSYLMGTVYLPPSRAYRTSRQDGMVFHFNLPVKASDYRVSVDGEGSYYAEQRDLEKAVFRANLSDKGLGIQWTEDVEDGIYDITFDVSRPMLMGQFEDSLNLKVQD